jgi:uncharacterized protein with NRDE domain
MCLLAFSYQSLADYPLVFAGNRDEFYGRPTAPAAFWDDAPHVLAGRDLEAGGTWMGVTRAGHWAVVTNVRDPDAYRADARSRGDLVAAYLRSEPDPRDYLRGVADEADRYNGFNLLAGTPDSLYYFSTRSGEVEAVEPGVHGLSNDRLDTPWPKVRRAKEALRGTTADGHVSEDALFDLLDDRRPAPDEDLPDTGMGLERERMLSPIFIEGDRYGTRASTILLIGRDGTVLFVERTFEDGDPAETRRFSFDASVPTGP